MLPDLPVRCSAQIRYKSPPVEATARMDGEHLIVTFDAPVKAVAPGQAVVLYDGDRVLGGGWIDAAIP